jgi:hypothetical protein
MPEQSGEACKLLMKPRAIAKEEILKNGHTKRMK